MKQAQWTGGGAVAADGTEAPEMLTYTKDVPAGPFVVPAATAMILRSPNEVPPAAVEPGSATDGGAPGDASSSGNDGGAVAAGDAGSGGATTGRTPDGGLAAGGASGNSGGCGCHTTSSHEDETGLAVLAALTALLARRRKLHA